MLTGAFTKFFYIQSLDRSSGVRVNCAGHSVAPRMVVSVPGAMAISSDGERYIQASETPQQTGTADVKPLGLRNAALGGSGLNNMGILVRTWGKVVENDPVTEPAWFTIDDGSGLNVKCVVPSGVTIDQGWNYVGVISASSCEEVRDDLYPLIRVREQDDIRAH